MWVSSVCQWFHYKFTSVFSKNYQGGMLAVQCYSASNLVVDIKKFGTQTSVSMLQSPFALA